MGKKIGRPTKYKPEFDELVYKLALLGMKDSEIASFFEVTEQTVNNWKADHPSFFESLTRGKDEADLDVVVKLRERALGYSHPAEKIFCNKDGDVTRVDYTEHYPPEPRALQYWLNNRQRGRWANRQEITGEDGGPLGILVVPERDEVPEKP